LKKINIELKKMENLLTNKNDKENLNKVINWLNDIYIKMSDVSDEEWLYLIEQKYNQKVK